MPSAATSQMNSNFIRLGLLVSFRKGRATAPKHDINIDIKQDHYLITMDCLRNSVNNLKVIQAENDVLVNDNDILVLWDGSNAGEFLKAQKGILSSTLAKITIKYPINKSFLYYSLKSLQPHIQSKCVGMGIPHVDRTFIKSLKILTPDVVRQKQIADFLDQETDRIDRLIEKKKGLILLL